MCCLLNTEVKQKCFQCTVCCVINQSNRKSLGMRNFLSYTYKLQSLVVKVWSEKTYKTP